MFDNIASTYDLLDHVLSCGLDFWWRRQTMKLIREYKHDVILDVACGTGPLAIKASKLGAKKIIGVDVSKKMIELGSHKIQQKGLENVIALEVGDCEALRFSSNYFDVTMAGFGVRNFDNLEKGLGEMYRVTKPKGIICILEFSKPRHAPVKQLYWFYCRHVIPIIGALVARDKAAYDYLPESISRFADGKDFERILQKVGYSEVRSRLLSSGVATLYFGVKS